MQNVSMSTEENTGRILAEGPDFRMPENRTAIAHYLTARLNVALECQPTVRPDGSLIIQLANMEGCPAFETVRWLTVGQPTHTVQDQVVRFTSLQPSGRPHQYFENRRQDTSRQATYAVGRAKGQSTGRGFGRGRGMWTKPHSCDQFVPGSPTQPSEKPPKPGYAERSIYPEGGGSLRSWSPSYQAAASDSGSFRTPKGVPFGTYGDTFSSTTGHRHGSGHGTSTTQSWSVPFSSPTGMHKSFEVEGSVSGVPASHSSERLFVEKGPTEGLDVITIKGLPRNATKDALLAAVQAMVRSVKHGVSCVVRLTTWSSGEARVHISDIEGVAVFALWRVRHKHGSSLKYDGHLLSWDVSVPEVYEDNRILVEGLPEDMTQYKLELHISCADCVRKEDRMTAVLLKDASKAIVFFDDDIVGPSLVEELNRDISVYEGAGDVDTLLTYSLVPICRSLRLRGLEATIDKGAVRNYFDKLRQDAKMQRPVLVDDIKMAGDGSAIVRFRIADDCTAVLSLPKLPGIGPKQELPIVEAYSEFPRSPTIVPSSAKGDDVALTNPVSDEAEPPFVEIVPEEQVVLDFIWEKQKHLRRLKGHLGCDKIRWDGSKIAILNPTCNREEYEKKIYGFTDSYVAKKVVVSDRRLWEKSLDFVEKEMVTRSGEVKLLPLEDKLEIQFVGPESEVTPFHQHCANQLSTWRTKFEEEITPIQEAIPLPSVHHLSMLQRTRSYSAVPDEVTVVRRQSGNSAYLDLQGPNALIQKTKDLLSQTLDSIAPVSVDVDRRIAKFLNVVSLQELNMLYETAQIGALAVEVKDFSVQILAFSDSADKAKSIANETYAVVSVNTSEDEHMQAFLVSEEYKEFVSSLCQNHVVMLDPEYDDMKESPVKAMLSLVGEKAAARNAATKLEAFLQDNVIFSDQVLLEHPGYVKFLEQLKADDLDQLRSHLGIFKAEIDVRRREDVIILRATKSGISQLREGVRNLVRRVTCDEKELKKHGLVKFLRSSIFENARSQIEKKNKTIVWVDGLDEDEEDDAGFTASHRLGTGSGTSTKLVEYAVDTTSHKRMCLYTGDICRHKVDAIVNAANSELAHGAGLAKNIVQCAGKSVQQECTSYIREHNTLPTGNAMYTTAGRLSTAKHIIHAVGPRWPYQARDTVVMRRVEKDMEDAVKASLELASKLKCTTLAFPAISSGIFGCPSEFVAKHIVRAASRFLTETSSTTVRQVHIVLLETDTEKISCFKESMKRELVPIENPVYRPKPRRTNRVETSDLELVVPVVPSSFGGSTNKQLKVTVKAGDITSENTDVIVNSTNSSISLDSALASKVIAMKAGPGLQAECAAHVSNAGTLLAGGIFTSSGYNLSCQFVVHVYCPNNPQGLSKAVEDCLNEARSKGARSVSFPALGTGRMGMADHVAAKAMFDGIDRFASSGPTVVRNVNVVIYDAPKLPIFQKEQTTREGIEVDESEEIMVSTSSSGGYRLTNGTILSVEQGDVTTDNSDVIVAPTGVVYTSVATKSLQTNSDLSAKYGGKPNPVADLSAGGQLVCSRVYAISVPSKSSGSSDDQCIRAIQGIVDQCLNLANTSGHTSIAIPAIGTGGLGYSNKHAAAAVIEASKAFAAKYSAPSLAHIKISVFDAHRIGDFQRELQTRCTGQPAGGMLQKVARGFRSFGTAVSNFLTGGHQPQVTRRKKREMKSFSAGEADTACITVFADSLGTCQAVHSLLKQAVNENCVSEEVTDKIPERFDPAELKTLTENYGVALSFDVVGTSQDGTAKLTLSGFKDDVTAVHNKVLQRLYKTLKEEADDVNKERILDKVRWYWEGDNGSFQEYSDDVTVKLEKAAEVGESAVKIQVQGIEYEVDIAALVQRGRGRKTRKIKRQNKSEESGTVIPASWVDPGGKGHEYEVHKVKLTSSDPEYTAVHQAFSSTGGTGTIVCIERIQNPKLYKMYVQERQHMAKRRQKEIQSGAARLEVLGFHGTKAEVVNPIVSGGFNRSYAGLSAGKYFGAGVYFARDASYSCHPRYSPPDINNHRTMFYCNILLGMCTRGDQSMLQPPVIAQSGNLTDVYDSTVDNPSNPSVYVSCYRDNRVYPTYLITFT